MRNVTGKNQKVLEKKIKEINPFADRDQIISRKDIPKRFFHPHWLIAICLILIVIYAIITGIYLANNSCGNHYLVLSIIGATPLVFLFNIHIGERLGLSGFYKIYLIEGIWLLLISIVSFGFLENVVEQTYCSNMWCHPQINTAIYFNHLRDKVTQSEYHDICQQIYNSKQVYNNYDQRLTISLQSSMKMFCYLEGNCSVRENFNINLLVRLSSKNVLVLVIFLGLIQLGIASYFLYFSYILKTNKLKFTFYDLERFMTKKVKGPGQSHKEKNHKKGVKQDGVVEDQKSEVSNNDGVDMKNISNVVNDVDQLFSMRSQSTDKNDEEKQEKEQKLKEQQLQELMKKKRDMGESLDFQINLRRKSQQELEDNPHNVSFQNGDEENNNTHVIGDTISNRYDQSPNNLNYNYNDNISYLNQNNMSFNLDTQYPNMRDDDNTILPFQPTQTGFYENPEMNNTISNFSYTQENDRYNYNQDDHSVNQIPSVQDL